MSERQSKGRKRQVHTTLSDDELAALDQITTERMIMGVRITRPQLIAAFIRRGIAEVQAGRA